MREVSRRSGHMSLRLTSFSTKYWIFSPLFQIERDDVSDNQQNMNNITVKPSGFLLSKIRQKGLTQMETTYRKALPILFEDVDHLLCNDFVGYAWRRSSSWRFTLTGITNERILGKLSSMLWDNKGMKWKRVASVLFGSTVALPDTCKRRLLGVTLRRIQTGKKEDGFLTATGVPAFASQGHHPVSPLYLLSSRSQLPKWLGLEAVVPRAFLVENDLSPQIYNEMIQACEAKCFGQYSIGLHGAMQVLVSNQVVQEVTSLLAPFVDMESINSIRVCTIHIWAWRMRALCFTRWWDLQNQDRL